MLNHRAVALTIPVLVAMAPPVLAQERANAEASTNSEALAQEVRELRHALAALQARLDALEIASGAAARVQPSTTEATAPETETADTQGHQMTAPRLSVGPPALPPRNTIGDELTGVARADTAAPPNDPELQGFIPIPGTDTMVRLGGFAKVNAIYDFAPAGNADKLITATIPVSRAGGTRETPISTPALRASVSTSGGQVHWGP